MKYKFEPYKESTDPVLFHVEPIDPDKIRRYNELQAKKQYICDFIYDKRCRLAFDKFVMKNNVPSICLFVMLDPDEFLDMIFDENNYYYCHGDFEDVYKTMKQYETTVY